MSREAKTEDPADEGKIKKIELKRRTQNMYIDTFMQRKQKALSMFETIKEKTEIIRHVANEYGAEYDAETGKQLRQHASKALEEGQQVVRQCKKGLNAMKRQTNKLKTERDKSAELKNQIQIRRGIQSTLLRTFIDIVRDFKDAEDTYHVSLQTDIKRSVKNVAKHITDDEIENAISNNAVYEMMQNVLVERGTAHETFEAEAEYVRSKNADIRQLERGIEELRTMFEDLAQLIQSQSEKIDQIEVQVDAAVDNVEAGKVALKDAAVEVERIRKRICCILGIVGAIVVTLGVTGGIAFVAYSAMN